MELKAAQQKNDIEGGEGVTHNGQTVALVACGLRSKNPKFEGGVGAQEGEIKEALGG